MFWPFTVSINCSSHPKYFANSWPSASNFKCFSQSLEQFFLTVGQNNFGNKIPFFFKILKSGLITVGCFIALLIDFTFVCYWTCWSESKIYFAFLFRFTGEQENVKAFVSSLANLAASMGLMFQSPPLREEVSSPRTPDYKKGKVHIFWEGIKILRNLHRIFVIYNSSKIGPSQNIWTLRND